MFDVCDMLEMIKVITFLGWMTTTDWNHSSAPQNDGCQILSVLCCCFGSKCGPYHLLNFFVMFPILRVDFKGLIGLVSWRWYGRLVSTLSVNCQMEGGIMVLLIWIPFTVWFYNLFVFILKLFLWFQRSDEIVLFYFFCWEWSLKRPYFSPKSPKINKLYCSIKIIHKSFTIFIITGRRNHILKGFQGMHSVRMWRSWTSISHAWS